MIQASPQPPEQPNTSEKAKPEIREIIQNYICDLFFFSLAIAIIIHVPWYKTYIGAAAQKALLYSYYAYFILGIPYYYFFVGDTPNRTRQLVAGLMEYLSAVLRYPGRRFKLKDSPFPTLDQETKVSILFLMVKFFFMPLMICFVINHYFELKNIWGNGVKNGFGSSSRMLYDYVFVAIINILYLTDTLYFSFGYMVETKYLNNRVRSVEPTFFGWAVALACYPPFNGFVDAMYPWTKTDMIVFQNSTATFIFRAAIIIFTGIYVWATIALGAKCSNLTNRGIVDRGPYAFVRHPAYISKNLVWWIMTIPYLHNPVVIGAGIAWSALYYLRAITEERHLLADPDYVEYCKKVPWKFIPRIY